MEILVKKGVNVNALGGFYGLAFQAAIVIAARMSEGERASNGKNLIKELLEIHEAVNFQSRAEDGSSLLHAIVAVRDHELLKTHCDLI